MLRNRLVIRFLAVKSPLYLTKKLLGGQPSPMLWRWPVGFLFQKKKNFEMLLQPHLRILEALLCVHTSI